jgi:hypothetical protein
MIRFRALLGGVTDLRRHRIIDAFVHAPLGDRLTVRVSQQHPHPHPGAGPGLDPARLRQHRIDHLKRHLLGQLTQMTWREPARRDLHHARDDTLIQQWDSQP